MLRSILSACLVSLVGVTVLAQSPLPPAALPPSGPAILPPPPGHGGARKEELPKTVTGEDLNRLGYISDVEVAPDGRHAVYALQTFNPEEHKQTSAIWSLDLSDRNATPQRLTEDEERVDDPAWSRDGRTIYFRSRRSGSSQVWRVPSSGGSALQITSLPLDVTSFRLSPRLDRIFVTMDVFRHCLQLDCTVKELADAENAPAKGILFDQLYVRHGSSWSDGRRSQLFSITLDKRGVASATPVKLTLQIDGDVPDKPSGNREAYAVSPDGLHVTFAEGTEGAKEPWTNPIDLWEALASGGDRLPDGRPANDSAIPRKLTAENRVSNLQPTYSPDGTGIAYLTTERAGYASDRHRLALMDLKSGKSRIVAPDWDESIDRFVFAADGRSVYVTADYLGQHALFSIDLKSGKTTALTTEGSVERFDTGGDRVVYAASTLTSPAELFALGRDGHPRQLTKRAESLLSQRVLGPYETFSFAGAANDTVHAYLVKPPSIKPDKKYPLIVLLHDGPHASLGNRWSVGLNAQALEGVGLGTGVLIIDYHGSTGYGQAFTDSIRGDLATKPLEDLTAGIAAAAARSPWLDTERACAIGVGYGGYLVELLAGKMPTRFQCLVSHAGTFDVRGGYYLTDELKLPEWELGGPEFDKSAEYSAQSPIDGVKSWVTPLLLTHGELDYRVPYTQSLAAFTAGSRRQSWTRFLLFPDEGHELTRPDNIAQWYQTVMRLLRGSLR